MNGRGSSCPPSAEPQAIAAPPVAGAPAPPGQAARQVASACNSPPPRRRWAHEYGFSSWTELVRHVDGDASTAPAPTSPRRCATATSTKRARLLAADASSRKRRGAGSRPYTSPPRRGPWAMVDLLIPPPPSALAAGRQGPRGPGPRPSRLGGRQGRDRPQALARPVMEDRDFPRRGPRDPDRRRRNPSPGCSTPARTCRASAPGNRTATRPPTTSAVPSSSGSSRTTRTSFPSSRPNMLEVGADDPPRRGSGRPRSCAGAGAYERPGQGPGPLPAMITALMDAGARVSAQTILRHPPLTARPRRSRSCSPRA